MNAKYHHVFNSQLLFIQTTISIISGFFWELLYAILVMYYDIVTYDAVINGKNFFLHNDLKLLICFEILGYLWNATKPGLEVLLIKNDSFNIFLLKKFYPAGLLVKINIGLPHIPSLIIKLKVLMCKLLH